MVFLLPVCIFMNFIPIAQNNFDIILRNLPGILLNLGFRQLSYFSARNIDFTPCRIHCHYLAKKLVGKFICCKKNL